MGGAEDRGFDGSPREAEVIVRVDLRALLPASYELIPQLFLATVIASRPD